MDLPFPNPTTSQQWAEDLEAELGAPVSANSNDTQNIERVIGAESAGNKAGFLRDNNPFNLNTWKGAHSSLPGGTIVNEFGGVDVQTFPTVQAGLEATANQITLAPKLTQALKVNAPASVFGAALGTSAWKTTSYANKTTFPTLTPFTGSSAPAAGTTPVASSGGGSPWWEVVNPLNQNFLGNQTFKNDTQHPGAAVSSAADATAHSFLAPVFGWIEDGAADITFIGFGLVLLVIGLIVTFKGTSVGEATGKVAKTGGEVAAA